MLVLYHILLMNMLYHFHTFVHILLAVASPDTVQYDSWSLVDTRIERRVASKPGAMSITSLLSMFEVLWSNMSPLCIILF